MESLSEPSHYSEKRDDNEPVIDFLNIQLTGRSKELGTLQDAFERVQSQGTTEVVLIEGNSGLGKTMLAEALRESSSLQSGAYFVSGKFTDEAKREPYSSLTEALTDLCDLLGQFEEDHELLARSLLDSDERVLSATIIPNLSRATKGSDEQVVPQCVAEEENSNGVQSFVQLCLALQKFLSAVATPTHPVIMLLDDLQWSDAASFDVIESLLLCNKLHHTLIIGTLRQDDEGIYASKLRKFMTKDQPKLNKMWMQLEVFDTNEIVSVISKLTKIPKREEKVQQLADLILSRTGGNPFDVVEFLDVLHTKGLLHYNHVDKAWDWDVKQLHEANCKTSEVTANLVHHRMSRLGKDTLAILQVAAVQGYCFESVITKCLLTKHSSFLPYEAVELDYRVHEAITKAVELGIIEKNVDHSLHFCHDKIHQCIYNMPLESEISQATIHLWVAEVLTEIDQKKHVLAIANHLHLGAAELSRSDLLTVPIANRDASKVAISRFAFQDAAKYAQNGIDALDARTQWNSENYQLAIDLYSLGAYAEYSCSNFNACRSLVGTILKNAKEPLDKAKAYQILVWTLGADACFDEATDTATEAASELGLTVPKKPGKPHVIWMILKVKRMLKGMTDEQILSLPEFHSAEDQWAAKLLTYALYCAGAAGNAPYVAVTNLRLMELALSGKGLSPQLLSSYGLLLTCLGDFDEACRFGRLALRSQEERGSTPVGLLHVQYYMFLHHWKSNVHETLDPLKKSYHQSMMNGTFESAFLAINGYLQYALFSGSVELPSLEMEMKHYVGVMDAFDTKSHLHHTLPFLQFCMNLSGKATTVPTRLVGRALSEEDLLLIKGENIPLLKILILRFILAYLFNDDIRVLRKAMADFEQGPSSKVGHLIQLVFRFWGSLAHIELYRWSKKRVHLKKARQYYQTLKKWSNGGAKDAAAMVVLLEAELTSLKPPSSKIDHVIALYDIAIAKAGSNLTIEALANERAAVYYESQDLSGIDAAANYRDRALTVYSQWGATTKVSHANAAQTDVSLRCIIVPDDSYNEPEEQWVDRH